MSGLAVPCRSPLRCSFLYRALNRNLICNPFSTDKIALNERDAMLQRKFVDLVTIDNRDYDL